MHKKIKTSQTFSLFFSLSPLSFFLFYFKMSELEVNSYSIADDKHDKFITDTDNSTLITNESAITIDSNTSSLADHYSYDAGSSHDSLSTIATLEKGHVTQTDFQKSHNHNKPETHPDVIDIHNQLEELEEKKHKRHLSRSSMISTRSYDSTAYDMLLARLDSKENLVLPPPQASITITERQQDEADWGKIKKNYKAYIWINVLCYYRVLVSCGLRL